ncbi:MAG: methylthioribulose 1-phosphate dehydratase [Planctomycetales bacterium]|nr:methylthioribulose 1-phosphate dehydratase [Planctomycetales bacterium]
MSTELTIDKSRAVKLPHPLIGFEDEINDLRETGRLFYMRGWSVGTSSNYSFVVGNDPVELVITASGMDKGRLELTDFVRIDADGVPTAPEQPKSSAETMLHCVLAKKLPDVGAVLHTHSVWATLLSQHFYGENGFFIEDYEMLKGLEGVRTHQHREWVEIFDNTQDIAALANELEKRLSNRSSRPIEHGFLMRQHGLYTWGKTIAEARRHVEIFEFLFECVARKLGFAG